MAYDYTVLAGTQGASNHQKTDRMLEVAQRYRLPLVLFTEGGGGRPGERLDGPRGAEARRARRFTHLLAAQRAGADGRLDSGRCFAGNAALLGCCDVIIATEDTNIGMGGPAMIEGGGLGVYRARGDRPDVACRSPTASSTSWSRTRSRPSRWRRNTCPTSRAARSVERARPAPAAPHHPGEPAARLRHPHR